MPSDLPGGDAVHEVVAIVCYARCDPCQFGSHDTSTHSWMGVEDRDHAVLTNQIPTGTTFEELAETHPCNCHCQGRESSKVVRVAGVPR